MKATKHFKLEELVPQTIFDKYQEKAINFLKPNALIILDEIREILNVPLVCNTWIFNPSGSNYRGYRPPEYKYGAKFSQHREGNAFDLTSSKMSASQMRIILEKNQDKLSFPIRIEKWDTSGNEITWLHFDLKPHTGKNKIYFFKA